MGGCRIPEDLKTYNPLYIIEHSDSSDFQSTVSGTTVVGTEKVNINKAEKEYSDSRLTKTTARNANVQTPRRNQNKEINTNTHTCHHCGESVPQCTNKCDFIKTYQNENFNRANAERVPSRTDLLKRKLTNIFHSGRKQTCAITEHECTIKRKVYCANCRQRQMRKFQRKQQSQVTRPVYLVEDSPTSPSDSRDGSGRFRHLIKVCSQLSHLSSNSESLIKGRKSYKRRREVALDREIKKEYLKYSKRMEKLLKHQPQVHQPYLKHKYHVLASQRCQTPAGTSTQADAGMDSRGLPSTASGFWDFFFNKINARYQEAKSLTSSVGGVSGNFGGQAKKSERQQECQTFFPPTSQVVSASSQICHSSSVMTTPEYSRFSPQLSSMKSSPMNFTHINKQAVSPKATQVSFEQKKSCQESHEMLTNALTDKYKGEVLCIHNPPCILINGCLNLPKNNSTLSSKEPVKVFPVVTPEKKPGYLASRKLKKSKKKTCEQACQHHPPFTELQQYQSKVIQSVCNHNPPCKVLPGCARLQYDPHLVGTCVHVPMCKNVAECSIETEIETGSFVCEHFPRCFDIPECHVQAYEQSRGDVCTQARPKWGSVCRHQPSCIMIPRCLARVICESGALGGAIPDCTHLPPCELIPACCRKLPKDTVSNKIAKMVHSRRKR